MEMVSVLVLLRLIAVVVVEAPMPQLYKHSAMRARASAIAVGPRRFDPNTVPDLDTSTTVALERVRGAVSSPAAADRVLVSATPFLHGCSIAVISLPFSEHDDDQASALAPSERAGKLVRQRWPGQADLLRRLSRFS